MSLVFYAYAFLHAVSEIPGMTAMQPRLCGSNKAVRYDRVKKELGPWEISVQWNFPGTTLQIILRQSRKIHS